MKFQKRYVQTSLLLFHLLVALVGCSFLKPSSLPKTDALLTISLDTSKTYTERRNAMVQMNDETIIKLRNQLTARIPANFKFSFDDLQLLECIGDERGTKACERLQRLIKNAGDTGMMTADLSHISDVIMHAIRRDPVKDVKLNDEDFKSLENHNPDMLPPRKSWKDVLYKDDDGYVYEKRAGSYTRGFATGSNVKVIP